MGKAINITGQKYSKLTAVRFIKIVSSKYGIKHYWLFKCDCGKETIKAKNEVKSGHTSSCGCYGKEQLRLSAIKHGMRKTRFYKIWSALKSRCENKNHPNYKYYGFRNIKNFWKLFKSFKIDMYISYLEHCKKFGENNTTIDRIDNNGNYCKENCKWATRKEQSSNQSRNIKFHNETASEASRRLGGTMGLVAGRIKEGWLVDKAFTYPLRIKNLKQL